MTNRTVDTPEMAQPTPKVADPPTNVIQALCRVMADLPTISKEVHQPAPGQEGGVKYPFRSIEQIVPFTQDLFARYGIVLAPHRITKWDLREITVREKPWTDDRLTVLFRCYGPGGPTDFIELEVPGVGRDNSDKGSNKAMTAAMKYALTQALQIAGDDPDFERAEADQRPIDQRDDLSPPLITPAEVDIYLSLARKRGLTDDQIAAIIYGVTGSRADDVRYLYQTERDALTEATRAAIAARNGGEAPTTPQEPPNDPPATNTLPEPSAATADDPGMPDEFRYGSHECAFEPDGDGTTWKWTCRCGVGLGRFDGAEAAAADHEDHVRRMWEAQKTKDGIEATVAAAKAKRAGA